MDSSHPVLGGTPCCVYIDTGGVGCFRKKDLSSTGLVSNYKKLAKTWNYFVIIYC